MPATRLRVGIIGLAIVIAGCAGASSLGPATQGPPTIVPLGIWNEPSQASGPSFVRFPNATGTFVYGCGSHVCVWYAKGHNKLLGEISGFSDAQGVGVSPVNGDIYVADDGRSEIKVYQPNSTVLVHRYLDPGQFPVDVAVDRAGNVFVANAVDKNSGPGSVTVYDSAGTILRTLHDPNAFVGTSVAVDEHNLVLFCFNNRSGRGECDEFPNGRGRGVPTAFGIGFAGGSAFDSSEHFVVIDEVNAVADTFAGSTLCGSYALAGSNVPVMIAFDRSSRILYNANTAVRGIAAYTYSDCGSGRLRPTIVYDDGLGPHMSMTGAAVTPNALP
jgi:DNA-binding beta-propeller fold protein YncE